jgi:diacylglycerol kinase family enzyme
MVRHRVLARFIALVVGLLTGLLVGRQWSATARRSFPVAASRTVSLDGLPPDGTGVVLVANANAGNRLGPEPAEQLRAQLPGIEILEAEEGEDLLRLLRRAAARARVLGVVGGDGSVSAAADVARDADLPLLIAPAGTLNHLARDLGMEEVEGAVHAVRQAEAVRMDLGEIDGRTFVNAASVGLYPHLVASRERLEERIGKWPAALWGTLVILVRERPVTVEIDGRRRLAWLLFFGNGRYRRGGLAPTRRARLDDGVLDVRLVHAEVPWARTRLVASVLTGRLGRCRSYEARTARSVRIRTPDGPATLAHDGEVWEGSPAFEVRIRPRALTVLRPRP